MKQYDYRKWKLALAIVLISASCAAVTAQSDLPMITVDKASNLVSVALSPEDPQGLVEVFQVSNPYDPIFFYFEADWPNPTGSPHLGNFTVNPWTGDVFNADGCERLTSPSLAALQAQIQQGLGVSQAAYLALRVKKPICSSGQYTGDVNLDGVVDCTDVDLVKASFGKKVGQLGFNSNADLNSDGVVDVKDLAIVTQQLPAGTKCQ